MRLVASGDPPEFERQQVPDPVAAPDEEVVDLHSAALNRRDWWIWTAPDRQALPITLGSDGAGTISAVGSQVQGLQLGQEVVFDPTLGWGESEEHPTPRFDILGAPTAGTFAERVSIPAANVVPKPPRLS